MSRTMLKPIISKLRETIIKSVAGKLEKYGFDENGVLVVEKPLSEYDDAIRENLIALFDAKYINNKDKYVDYIHNTSRTFMHILICFKFMEKIGIMADLIKKMIGTDIYTNILPDFISVYPLAYKEFSLMYKAEIEELAQKDDRDEDIEYYQFIYLIEKMSKEMSKEVKILFGDFEYSMIQPDANDMKQIIGIIQHISDDEYFKDDFLGWIYQYWVDVSTEENKSAKVESVISYSNEIYYNVLTLFKLKQSENGEFYTPRWVVKYVVDNTLGNVIGSKPIEKISLLDPACGAGNYLVYAFDVFYEQYKTEHDDWNENDVLESILANNIHGVDIQRAPLQITALSLWFKTKILSVNANFRKTNLYKTNILQTNSLYRWENEQEEYIRLSLFEELQDIREKKYTVEDIDKSITTRKNYESDIAKNLFRKKYDVIVMNPPFVDTRKMNNETVQFLKEKYPDNARNLFSAFIERAIELLNKNGILGFISSDTFMYIGSFQKTREMILNETSIKELVKLGKNVFEGPTVDASISIFQKGGNKTEELMATNIEPLLRDVEKRDNVIEDTIKLSKRYTFQQRKFKKILGFPFIFDISEGIRNIFLTANYIGTGDKYPATIMAGMQTGENNKYLKKKWEIPQALLGKDFLPYAKGDGYCKYVNDISNYIVWDTTAKEYYNTSKKPRKNYLASYFREGDETYYLKPAITYSDITSENYFSARELPEGCIFDTTGSCIFIDESLRIFTLGFVNSKFANYILSRLNPSPHFQVSDMQRIPYIYPENEYLDAITSNTTEIIKLKKYLLGFNYISDFYHEVEIQFGFNKGALTIREAYEKYIDEYKGKCAQSEKLQQENDNLIYKLFSISKEDIEIIESEFPIKTLYDERDSNIQYLTLKFIRMVIKDLMIENGARLYTIDELIQLFRERIEKQFDNGYKIIEEIEQIEEKKLYDIFANGVKIANTNKTIFGEGPNDSDEPIIQYKKIAGTGKSKQLVYWHLSLFLLDFEEDKKYTMQNEIRRLTNDTYLPKLQRAKEKLQLETISASEKKSLEKEVGLYQECVKTLENWKVVD